MMCISLNPLGFDKSYKDLNIIAALPCFCTEASSLEKKSSESLSKSNSNFFGLFNFIQIFYDWSYNSSLDCKY